ncbi:hypothetical protein CYLTODRAFT_422493 [Cylindrobasidium torrendii FP15055 ss-10]|uniref:C-CAP/cofactor C-like domain-containing protein n=1 Tax=Cylindrobasidium torrendii FP15055 ss-10 TaxID=1314674 RepID=A0A0D7BAC0_9AGAR|nr:hypothetical protein CYLTODRAFT_422493 [Cylindrobasidium torrendii FP15055 ss-10]
MSAFVREFNESFVSDASSLFARVNDAAKSPQGVSNDVLAVLAAEVTKLSKSLAESMDSLPSYDRKGYEAQLKELEASVESLRKTSQPTSKFSFKRKAAAPKTTPASAKATTSVSPSTKERSDEAIVTIADRVHEIVHIDHPVGRTTDISISNLTSCVVDLLGYAISAVHVHNVRDSILLLPHLQSTTMIHDMENSIVVVGCHQFRMHTSHDIDVYLSIQSQPIIEHCSNIRFTSYPISLAPGESLQDSTHLAVQDFSHIKQTPSPNWSALREEDSVLDWSLTRTEDLDATLKALLPGSRL